MLHTPSTTKSGPDPTACLAQIDRITSNPLLQGSEGLCRLMTYLGEHALNFPTKHLKEYQIATEVLGRPADFDPHSDSSVRVQVGRLRNKLAEYYGSLATDDPILIEIPKGRYSLLFQIRSIPTEPASFTPLLPVHHSDCTSSTLQIPERHSHCYGSSCARVGSHGSSRLDFPAIKSELFGYPCPGGQSVTTGTGRILASFPSRARGALCGVQKCEFYWER